jgi:hypothetical protein
MSHPLNPPAELADLGELGKAKDAVALTFRWFGRTIRVNPGAGELDLMDFLTEAEKVELPEDPNDVTANAAAMQVTLDFLRRQIHPDDWSVWWDLAKTHRQTLQDLIEVASAIINKVTGFPTTPPSDSQPGPDGTPHNSRAVSSSAALTTKALGILAGRPDLQHVVLMAQEQAAG